MRITHSYLRKWLQEELNKTSDRYLVTSSHTTRFRPEDYHNGAYKLGFDVSVIGQEGSFMILCFLSIKELNDGINIGYTLFLKNNDRTSDCEIWLKKK